MFFAEPTYIHSQNETPANREETPASLEEAPASQEEIQASQEEFPASQDGLLTCAPIVRDATGSRRAASLRICRDATGSRRARLENATGSRRATPVATQFSVLS